MPSRHENNIIYSHIYRNTEVHTIIMKKILNEIKVSGYVTKRDVSLIYNKTEQHIFIFISGGSAKDPETRNS